MDHHGVRLRVEFAPRRSGLPALGGAESISRIAVETDRSLNSGSYRPRCDDYNGAGLTLAGKEVLAKAPASVAAVPMSPQRKMVAAAWRLVMRITMVPPLRSLAACEGS